MADGMGSDNSAATATFLGLLTPPGYQYPPGTSPGKLNFLVYDSVGENTGDPVDYFRFYVPEGLNQIKIALDATLIGGNEYANYTISFISSGATLIAGKDSTHEGTGLYAENMSFNDVNGLTSTYAIRPGEHVIRVDMWGFTGPESGPAEHQYRLAIDVGSYETIQPGSDPSQPGGPDGDGGGIGTDPDGGGGPGTGPGGGTTDGGTGPSMATINTIRQYYANILQRTGSEVPDAELNRYAGDVDGGLISLEGVRAALIASADSEDVQSVIRLYQTVFGRIPDKDGLNFQVDTLRGPASALDMAGGFAASPEFSSRFGGDQVTVMFLTAVYEQVLGRTPGASEIDFYLSSGFSAARVALAFSESPEFKTQTLDAVHNFLDAAGQGVAVYSGPLGGSPGGPDLPGPSPVGSTFYLSPNADRILGTSADDLIVGVPSDGDAMAGDAGTDTLQITGFADLAATNVSIAPGEIEILDIGSNLVRLTTSQFNAFYNGVTHTIKGDGWISFADNGNVRWADSYGLSTIANFQLADGGQTFFGSNGRQGLLIVGGNGRDNISAGFGDDIIIGGAGGDSLTGDEGVDTYQFNRGDSTLREMDTIHFSDDTLAFNNPGAIASVVVLSSDQLSSIRNMANIETAVNAVAAIASFDGDTVEFWRGAELYIFHNADGNATYDDGVDYIINVSGMDRRYGTLESSDVWTY